LIAAEGVCAKQIDSRIIGTEKTQVCVDKSQPAIAITSHKEFQRKRVRGVFRVSVERAGTQLERINKGTKVEMLLRVYEMQAHRWQIRILAILFNRIVGRKKTGTEDYAMQGAKDE
jgi:hypothetical protein